MTHKTLKEAYESVGLTMQNGDQLWHHTRCFLTIRWIEGSCFEFKADSLTVYRWDLYQGIEKITRDGKQIYPKVEDEDESYSCLVFTLINSNLKNPHDVASAIKDLIDAKIKEAK